MAAARAVQRCEERKLSKRGREDARPDEFSFEDILSSSGQSIYKYMYINIYIIYK